MGDLLAFFANESSLALLVLASPTVALAATTYVLYRHMNPVREVNGEHKHLLTREEFFTATSALTTRQDFNAVVSAARSERRAHSAAIGLLTERVAGLEATVKSLHDLIVERHR